MVDLAYLLENGKYVQKNINHAYDLLLKAAEKKNPRGLNNLGTMYFHNTAPSSKKVSNEQKAFECFKEATDQGYAKAFVSLGICYDKGKGVLKDSQKALE